MAEALYRKYRPQTFEDVVGQEHIERTIRNAIQTDKVSHAYLFTGPRGTGKTTTARLLAKALLCEGGPTPDPDGTCEDCELIALGEHPDVYELDAASRTGVENVREEIIGRVNYAPTRGRYKVYIIDEVHMLSVAAFNALLKTLEEPPEHVVFVLCTTDPQKVPETIQSRCQRFDFRRISSEELISRLGAICEMEGVEYEGDALDLIAHRAQGGMRDALTSLEQLITFSNGSVTSVEAERLLGALDSSDLADIVKAIGTRDVAACFRWTSSYVETGADLAQITKDLAEHIRDMYVMSLAGADVALEVTEAGRRELESELAWFGPDRLARLLAVLGDLIAELKTSTNQRLSFEIALTRMVRPESDITLASLAERIETIERGGVVVPASTGVTAFSPVAQASAPAQEQSANPRVVSAQSANVQAAAVDAGASQLQEHLDAGSAEAAAGTQAPAKVKSPMSMPSVGAAASESVESAPLSDASAQTSASSSQAGDVSLSGRDVMQVWNSILSALKKQNEAYGVLFMNTFVSSVDGGKKLLIEFSAANKFAFNAAKKPEIKQALESAFAGVGLAGMSYEITQGDKPASSAVSQTSTQSSASQPTSSQAPQSEARTSPATQSSAVPHQAQQGAMGQGAQDAQGAQVAQGTQGAADKSQGASFSAQDSYDEPYVPDDYVPLEAYEDASSAVSATQPVQQAEPDRFADPNAAESSAATQPAQDAVSGATPSASEPSMSEISDNLASMFGEGVVIEEIQ